MAPAAAPSPVRRWSLVAQATDSIRDALRHGFWRERLPSERELCQHLQVSRITLRSALAHLEREGWLRASGRKRREIVRPRGRRSRKPRLRTIALLSSRPLTELSSSALLLIGAIRDALNREGFALDYCVSAACYAPHPERALEEITERRAAAAWILFDSMAPIQRWFTRSKYPCLVVGGCVEGISLPSVAQNFRATCRHAAGLLLRHGHRRVALVLPPGVRGGEMDTERGVREALGANPAASLVIIRHDGTAPNLCALLQRAVRSAHPPTAYIVARAIHVPTVMMYLMTCGLRMPRDVAVLSRDDEIFLQHTVPNVTRYSTSTGRFSRCIAIAAKRLAEGRVLPERTMQITPELIKGATV